MILGRKMKKILILGVLVLIYICPVFADNNVTFEGQKNSKKAVEQINIPGKFKKGWDYIKDKNYGFKLGFMGESITIMEELVKVGMDVFEGKAVKYKTVDMNSSKKSDTQNEIPNSYDSDQSINHVMALPNKGVIGSGEFAVKRDDDSSGDSAKNDVILVNASRWQFPNDPNEYPMAEYKVNPGTSEELYILKNLSVNTVLDRNCFSHSLGIKQGSVYNSDSFNVILKKYFNVMDKPQVGDLVVWKNFGNSESDNYEENIAHHIDVLFSPGGQLEESQYLRSYYEKLKHNDPVHAGIITGVDDEGNITSVESKQGICNGVTRTSLIDSWPLYCPHYDTVEIHRLKGGAKGKEFSGLLEDIEMGLFPPPKPASLPGPTAKPTPAPAQSAE